MKKVFFLSCFGPKVGWGHISRVKSLTRAMNNFNVDVTICLLEGENVDLVFGGVSNIRCITIDSWLAFEKMVCDTNALLVIDLPQVDYPDEMQVLNRLNNKTILIDDITQRRLLASVNIYPPTPIIDQLDWETAIGSVHSGWEYAVIDPDLYGIEKAEGGYRGHIAVVLGGTDASGLLANTVQSLVANEEVNGITVISGVEVGLDIAPTSKLEILVNPIDRFRRFAEADMVICTYGVTMFELHYLDVPTAYFLHNEENERSASMFSEKPNFWNLGRVGRFSQTGFEADINRVIGVLKNNNRTVATPRHQPPCVAITKLILED